MPVLSGNGWFGADCLRGLEVTDRKIIHLSWARGSAGGAGLFGLAGVLGCWLCGGLGGEGDGVAEGFELADVVAGFLVLVGVPLVVVGAEVAVAGVAVG